jgi:hypothetical protein
MTDFQWALFLKELPQYPLEQIADLRDFYEQDYIQQ